jgi:hypothetical protein
MTVASGFVGRASAISLRWLVVAFTVAQLLDLVSALVVARELNPIVASMVAQPILGLALKLALIAFVVATADAVSHRLSAVAATGLFSHVTVTVEFEEGIRCRTWRKPFGPRSAISSRALGSRWTSGSRSSLPAV